MAAILRFLVVFQREDILDRLPGHPNTWFGLMLHSYGNEWTFKKRMWGRRPSRGELGLRQIPFIFNATQSRIYYEEILVRKYVPPYDSVYFNYLYFGISTWNPFLYYQPWSIHFAYVFTFITTRKKQLLPPLFDTVNLVKHKYLADTGLFVCAGGSVGKISCLCCV